MSTSLVRVFTGSQLFNIYLYILSDQVIIGLVNKDFDKKTNKELYICRASEQDCGAYLHETESGPIS